jgi:hypothetical protein
LIIVTIGLLVMILSIRVLSETFGWFPTNSRKEMNETKKSGRNNEEKEQQFDIQRAWRFDECHERVVSIIKFLENGSIDWNRSVYINQARTSIWDGVDQKGWICHLWFWREFGFALLIPFWRLLGEISSTCM